MVIATRFTSLLDRCFKANIYIYICIMLIFPTVRLKWMSHFEKFYLKTCNHQHTT